MKNNFCRTAIIFLFSVVFSMLTSFEGFNAGQLGISNEAEASMNMEQDQKKDLTINVVEDAQAIPASTPPEIIKSNDRTSITPKANFEKESDIALSKAIQQKLEGNTQLSGSLIHIVIKTMDGSVVLKGTARNEDDRTNIVHQVENMAGVDSVDNQINIASE